MNPPLDASQDESLDRIRQLLVRLGDETVRARLHRPLALWETGYVREALSQFRVLAERSLARLLACTEGAGADSARELLSRGQCAKVVEWLYRDAERIPARIALHLHTLLGWGSYGSHHQRREHSARSSDLALLVGIAVDLEDWLATTAEGQQSPITDRPSDTAQELVVDRAVGAGLDPVFARAFVQSTRTPLFDASRLRCEALELELHWTSPTHDVGRSPFPGLRHFEVSDAERFFGRDALLRRLTGRAEHASLTLLSGPSGVGKTSLLRAGLVPWATARGLRVVVLADYTADSLSALVQIVRAWPAGEPLLVLLDQLERGFFSEVPAIVRRLLIELLLSSARWPGINVVCALRDDYYGRLLREADRLDSEATPLLQQPGAYLTMEALTRAQAREAIVAPLAHTEIRFSDALVEAILELPLGDSDGISPLLLQLVCAALVAQAQQSGTQVVDRGLVEQLGGPGRLLDAHLSRVLSSPSYQGQRDAARALLKAMVGAEGRRWVELGQIWQALSRAGQVCDEVELSRLLQRLTRDRLVVARTDGPTEAGQYSLVHEAVADTVSAWRSQAELEIDQAQELLDRALARATGAAGQGALDHAALGAVERHLPSLRIRDRVAVTSLLRLSRRTRRRRRTVTGAMIALTAVGLSFGVYQLDRAIRQRDRALAAADRGVLLRAQIELDRDPTLAIAWLRNLSRAGAGVGARTLLQQAQGRGVAHVLAGHRDLVTSVAYSPDGQTVLTASRDGDIRLWDRHQRRPRGPPLQGHEGHVTRAVFSPDGSRIASAGWDRTVRLWDSATRRPIGDPLRGHTDWVHDLAFGPAGQLLASAGADGTIRLWDTRRRTTVAVLRGYQGSVSALSFAPDGAWLASAGVDGTVRRFAIGARQQHGPALRGTTEAIHALAYSPDGQLLAAGGLDGKLRLWRSSSGELLLPPFGKAGNAIVALAFAPGGKLLAAGGEDKLVRLWHLPSGRQHRLTLRGHQGFIRALSFSPDGKQLASASSDETIRLWDLTPPPQHTRQLGKHDHWALDVACSHDGKLLASTGRDGTVRLWDLARGRASGAPLHGSSKAMYDVAFSPSARWLAAVSREGQLMRWQVGGAPDGLTVTSPQSGGLTSVTFGWNDGTIVTGAGDGTLLLWRGRPGTRRLEPATPAVWAHSEAIFALATSAGARLLASGGRGGSIRLWRLSDGSLRTAGDPIDAHRGAIYGLAFAPDGSLLASVGADGAAKLWHVDSGKPWGRPLRGHQHWVLSVAFADSRRTLATAGTDGTIRLWETQRGTQLGAPLYGHTGAVHALAFTPNGKTLASAGEDGRVVLWPIHPLDPHGLAQMIDSATNLHVSPDGELSSR